MRPFHPSLESSTYAPRAASSWVPTATKLAGSSDPAECRAAVPGQGHRARHCPYPHDPVVPAVIAGGAGGGFRGSNCDSGGGGSPGGGAHSGAGSYQCDQHGLGAGRGVSSVLYAGRLRHAGSRLRTFPRVGEHPGRGNRGHLYLRCHLLALGLRLHVRAGHPVDRHHWLRAAGSGSDFTAPREFLSWPSGYSSSPSRTPAPPSPRVR